MNIEEQTQNPEELESTPAEVVEEGTEEVVEETTEETPEETEEVDEEESTEEVEEDPAENPKESSSEVTSESFVAEAKKLFPDQKFENETDVYSAILAEQKRLKVYEEENNAANERVMDVLTAEPKIGEIIKDMDSGATFEEALAIHVDIEALKNAEGEPDSEAWKSGKAKRKKLADEYKAVQDEINNNITTSGTNLEKFRTAKEMSEDESNDFVSAAHEVVKDIQNGLVTDKFLEFMFRGLNWEDALKESRSQGEIRGKNEKIIASKSKKTGGDGLPRVKSEGQPDQKKTDPIAQSIIDYQKKKTRF